MSLPLPRRAIVLAALLSVVLCSGNHVVIDRASNRHGWVKAHRADAEKISKITVGVRVRDPDELERTFFEVSDPSNPRYGQHLTFDEVGDLISNAEATAAVVRWLQGAGLTDITPSAHGELVSARGPVRVLEALLQTQFFEYHHSKVADRHIMAAEQYSMPQELTEHSYGVLGVLPLPLKVRKSHSAPRSKKLQATTSSCSGYICPSVLQKYYNISTLSSAASVSIGVYEVSTSSSGVAIWSEADTEQFFDLILGQTISKFPVSCWDNTGCHITSFVCPDANNCGEANLDMQTILGLTDALMHVNYTYDSGSVFLLDWIEEIASERSPSSVYSISYGADEFAIDSSTLITFDTLAKVLGTQGVSIIVASGDDGANLKFDGELVCEYNPQWPASSPYVTAVGATQGVESGTEEVVCETVITSGGGFSNAYTMPSYQSCWVNSYLNRYSSTVVAGFSSGRGYPDVSMAGYNYEIIVAGERGYYSGTSASTPVFATMIALINNHRAKQNLPKLGFLNPALYAYGTTILKQDITNGSNKCDAEVDSCCETGFNAVSGWDPVTGLGSIDYAKLLNQTQHGNGTVSRKLTPLTEASSTSSGSTSSGRTSSSRMEIASLVGAALCSVFIVMAVVKVVRRRDPLQQATQAAVGSGSGLACV